jgi:rRNA-processing protein FCF1
MRAANWLANVAPRDGTVIGAFDRQVPLFAVLGRPPAVTFKASDLNWLGTMSSYAEDAYVLWVRRDAAAKTLGDLLRPGGPSLKVGGSAAASTDDSTVIALRGKDEFNLVIPYVRFVPHDVDVPLVVVDTSVLIDGRIARLCESGFMSAALVIPRFVLDELHAVADSTDPHKQARGRRGLEILGELRKIKNIDIRITESEVANSQHVDAKLVFLAKSMRAKLLTTDYNLAKLAEFHGVPWLNLNQLAKALRPELLLGETLEVDLVKAGKEEGQAVGFLEDGSMVVVNAGRGHMGKRVSAEIISVLPSAGGKMVFARMLSAVE